MAKRKEKTASSPVSGRCRGCGAEFRSNYALKQHRFVCPKKEAENVPSGN